MEANLQQQRRGADLLQTSAENNAMADYMNDSIDPVYNINPNTNL